MCIIVICMYKLAGKACLLLGIYLAIVYSGLAEIVTRIWQACISDSCAETSISFLYDITL